MAGIKGSEYTFEAPNRLIMSSKRGKRSAHAGATDASAGTAPTTAIMVVAAAASPRDLLSLFCTFMSALLVIVSADADLWG